MAAPMGAIVEIVEYLPASEVDEMPCIKPHAVRVNGVDVGLCDRDNPARVYTDDDGTLRVDLHLIVRRVEFKAVEGER